MTANQHQAAALILLPYLSSYLGSCVRLLQIVADFLAISIYYTNMERHAYPFLPEEPEGLEALKLSHQLRVGIVSIFWCKSLVSLPLRQSALTSY